MSLTNSTISAEVYFHKGDELYDSEKPYLLRYEPRQGAAKTNIKKEKHYILIHDMRGSENMFTHSSCGFAVTGIESTLAYEDFAIADKVQKIFLGEVASSVQDLFGGSHVHVFNSLVSFELSVLSPAHCTRYEDDTSHFQYQQAKNISSTSQPTWPILVSKSLPRTM